MHPSGTTRYRFLIQRRQMMHQRYFKTLEEAKEYRDYFLNTTYYHSPNSSTPVATSNPTLTAPVSFSPCFD